MSYERGAQPNDMEAEARVLSPQSGSYPSKRAVPELPIENPCVEIQDRGFSPLRGVLANENVLEIKVTRFCKGTYHAYYVGEKSQGVGSTPFMAVHALINAFNTTDVWNGRFGFD